MIKLITFTGLLTFMLVGCGATGSTEDKTKSSDNIPTGKYDLWSYMVPSESKKNTFTLKTDSKTSTYTTEYKVSRSQVKEVSDYAKEETTIYEKLGDKIIVSFEKNSQRNGKYELVRSADEGDMVTIRDSSCKLFKHHNSIKISDKTFQDVIEITCNGIPGYYQKGVGEVAQKEDSAGKSIRILSN